jgi:large subunit ribosomal protein L30
MSAPRAGAGSAALRVTQRKSGNGANPRQRATLRSLGLHRIGHTVEVTDTPAARGMVQSVRHLVSVEEPK